MLIATIRCASSPAPPAQLSFQNALATQCTAPETYFGDSRGALKARLGAPLSEDVEKIPNRHVENMIDQRVTLRFGGVEAVLHEVPEYKRSFLAQVRLTRKMDELRLPVSVGDPLHKIHSVLGHPADGNEVSLIYYCPSEMQPTVAFYVRAERVWQIEWINEPD